MEPEALQDAFDRIDPLPPRLADRLAAAFDLRSTDAELARLTEEGPDDDRGSRLGFVATGCTVDLVVSRDPDDDTGECVVVADVRPVPPTAATLDTPTRSVDATVRGHTVRAGFRGGGPVRLRLVFAEDPGPRMVETEWVTL